MTLIYNDKYNIYNNFYTMFLARHYLADTYVIDADNYFNDNFLLNHLENSTYFSAYKTHFKQEWVLHTDKNQVVTDITIEDGEGSILCGVSYWNTEDGQLLQQAIEKRFEKGNYGEIYWDNIVLEQLSKLKIIRQDIPANAVYEIDSLEDLQYLYKALKHKPN
ncbi:LicC protein [Streptococcus sp. oral taxon 056 str. F0418]|nr:LicC protein [Streptococcus sp. oral taxon 056 str. F0418]